jgi:hypothetical protein
MSAEQYPTNDYENEPGKPEEKNDTPTNNSEPSSSNPVSASDKVQADIKSLRGDYGQNTDTLKDLPTTHERVDMGESKY